MAGLVVYAAPAEEPVTTAEVMAFIRSDTTEESALTMFIKSARASAESITRRALVTQTLDLYLDQFPWGDIVLPRPKVQSITAITYVDSNGTTQTLSTDNYVLDSVSEPGRVALAYGYSWPTARTQNNSIKVRYLTGYGLASSVPDGIKHWMLMRIKQLYDQRDSVSMASNMLEMPYKFVDGLLDSYIVPNFEWDSSCS